MAKLWVFECLWIHEVNFCLYGVHCFGHFVWTQVQSDICDWSYVASRPLSACFVYAYAEVLATIYCTVWHETLYMSNSLPSLSLWDHIIQSVITLA